MVGWITNKHERNWAKGLRNRSDALQMTFSQPHETSTFVYQTLSSKSNDACLAMPCQTIQQIIWKIFTRKGPMII